MPNPNIKEIVDKVHSILRDDSRTKSVNWERGDLSLDAIRTLPAGTVSLLVPGLDIRGDTMPTGMGGTVPVIVRIRTRRHEGQASTDQSVEDIISNVVEVLWDKRKLDLTRVKTLTFSGASQETNAEATPPYSEAAMVVNALLHL